MMLRDKIVLVTGGAVRLGAAIVEALAAAGAQPVIHFHRSKSEACASAKRLRGLYGTKAYIIGSEIRTEAQCRNLIRRAAARAGGLDGLINNAAVFHKDSLAGSDGMKLDVELRTNLLAPIHLTRAFIATASRGAIVNLLDRRISGHEAGCFPYLLSKKSLADFTRIAALELAPRFRVNAVAPGAVLPPPGRPETALREQAGRVPLELQVKPADVADAVLYLLRARAVTGQIIFVDGGQHVLGTANG